VMLPIAMKTAHAASQTAFSLAISSSKRPNSAALVFPPNSNSKRSP